MGDGMMFLLLSIFVFVLQKRLPSCQRDGFFLPTYTRR